MFATIPLKSCLSPRLMRGLHEVVDREDQRPDANDKFYCLYDILILLSRGGNVQFDHTGAYFGLLMNIEIESCATPNNKRIFKL